MFTGYPWFSSEKFRGLPDFQDMKWSNSSCFYDYLGDYSDIIEIVLWSIDNLPVSWVGDVPTDKLYNFNRKMATLGSRYQHSILPWRSQSHCHGMKSCCIPNLWANGMWMWSKFQDALLSHSRPRSKHVKPCQTMSKHEPHLGGQFFCIHFKTWCPAALEIRSLACEASTCCGRLSFGVGRNLQDQGDAPWFCEDMIQLTDITGYKNQDTSGTNMGNSLSFLSFPSFLSLHPSSISISLYVYIYIAQVCSLHICRITSGFI